MITGLLCGLLLTLQLTPYPVTKAYTPNSLLSNPSKRHSIQYAGDRPRYSTCTGVCWCPGDEKLLTINFLTEIIWCYRFNREELSLTPTASYSSSKLKLSYPENIALSSNQKFAAIPNMRNGRVNLYKLNSNGELTTPPLFSISSFQAHSAQFSPDSRFLAYSSLGKDAHVKLMEIQEAPFFNLIGKQKLNCPFEPMRPKSVAFSHDGKFVAIGYCTQLGNKIGYSSGMLALHRYQKRGWINPTPTSIVENLTSTETIAFHPRTATIVAVDQVLDRVTAHQYNPNSGEIETSWTILEGEVSELFLPHGLHFSQDGRFLAVTNYGDDKVTVYEASW